MSKKRLLSIVISAVILLSFACTVMAAEKSERYVGDSTVNGSIYQTYYQVDAQTRTGIKSISVSGSLYEKGTFGTWQRVSNCYIVGKRNGGRLGATSFCKCYFISDFAFNLLWIAPTPLWEEFLFEVGS